MIYSLLINRIKLEFLSPRFIDCMMFWSFSVEPIVAPQMLASNPGIVHEGRTEGPGCTSLGQRNQT